MASKVESGPRIKMRMGDEALTQFMLQNKIALVTGVYGDPCTPLLDRFTDAKLPIEISLEEKSAMAQALGASVAGKRSVVAVKQVGMNVLADPLTTAAIHGIGAGLLIICGDDPGAVKSQNEQDSRWYAKLAEVPVFTPHNPTHLAECAREAFRISDELGIPVMLQITSRLMAMSDEYKLPAKLGKAGQYDRSRPWGRFILDRHKNHLEKIWPELINQVEASTLHKIDHKSTADGVISCGFVSNFVNEAAHLALATANPLPEKLVLAFLKNRKRVLIVEEIAPIVEEGVRAIAGAHGFKVEVLGRLTGHLPRAGQLERRHVESAFSLSPAGLNFDTQVELSNSLNEVPCGGFELLYQVLDTVVPQDQLVAGDVGCNILQGYFAPQTIDTAFGLGTSIGTAAGMSLSGKKGVAIIGDVGFLHSGITNLLDVIEHGHNLLVIVLNNEIPAMTPGKLGSVAMGKLKSLIEACGPKSVDEVNLANDKPSDLKKLFEKRLSEKGVQVVIVKAKAVKSKMGM